MPKITPKKFTTVKLKIRNTPKIKNKKITKMKTKKKLIKQKGGSDPAQSIYHELKPINYPKPPTPEWGALGTNILGIGVSMVNMPISLANIVIDLYDVIRFGAEDLGLPKHIH